MARPATGQTPPISFRPPQQLLKDFDATIEEGRSRSDVLIELMHDRVAKKERERAAAERAAQDGDPDTRCGDAYRPDPKSTDPRSVARCTRGHGHPGEHVGWDFNGRQQYQWPERPASSEEKTA